MDQLINHFISIRIRGYVVVAALLLDQLTIKDIRAVRLLHIFDNRSFTNRLFQKGIALFAIL